MVVEINAKKVAKSESEEKKSVDDKSFDSSSFINETIKFLAPIFTLKQMIN